MTGTTKDDAIKRLSYMQGHLEGVRRMVEDDKYCVDILKQLYAVRRATEKLGAVLLQDHLNTCVVSGVRDGRENEVLQELVELYSLANR